MKWLMATRREPGQEMRDAEAEPVVVDVIAGGLHLQLDDGTELVLDLDELMDELDGHKAVNETRRAA